MTRQIARLYSRLKAFISAGDQRIYYWILVLALLVPNLVLSIVMQQSSVGRILNVLVMLPSYMLLLGASTGVWWC